MKQQRETLETDLTREKARCEAKLAEMQRKHQLEVKQEKERLKIEQEEWKSEQLRKNQEQMADF